MSTKPKAPKGYKYVVALRKGFYGNAEKNPGDEFLVTSKEEATWFDPVDKSLNGDTVLAMVGEPSSPKPTSAVQTFNLTGDEDHDPPQGEPLQHGDKLTGFEHGDPGKPAKGQDPDTLSKIAKEPVVTPVAADNPKLNADPAPIRANLKEMAKAEAKK